MAACNGQDVSYSGNQSSSYLYLGKGSAKTEIQLQWRDKLALLQGERQMNMGLGARQTKSYSQRPNSLRLPESTMHG